MLLHSRSFTGFPGPCLLFLMGFPTQAPRFCAVWDWKAITWKPRGCGACRWCDKSIWNALGIGMSIVHKISQNSSPGILFFVLPAIFLCSSWWQACRRCCISAMLSWSPGLMKSQKGLRLRKKRTEWTEWMDVAMLFQRFSWLLYFWIALHWPWLPSWQFGRRVELMHLYPRTLRLHEESFSAPMRTWWS